jgi:hypothetical protein
VKEGDANTKYFDAHATIRHRKNSIACLLDDLGNEIIDHDGKAHVLWELSRKGYGNQISVECFTRQEIDNVVAELPNNKSPGPDGFNNEFIKGCWPLIAQDYYNLFETFFEREICMRSINTSHIALIPKKDGPTTAADYKPISLLNSSFKLITKVLANRLQKVIRQIIHKNQYGFIKSRTIQDCVAWALEYIHLCHKSRK